MIPRATDDAVGSLRTRSERGYAQRARGWLIARWSEDSRWPLLVLAALLFAVAIAVLRGGRGTIFFYDEWAWVLLRRGHSLNTLLSPHNNHLIVVPLLLYKLLLQIAGMRHYWVFRVAAVGFDLLVCGLLFEFARRRVGRPLAVLVVAGLAFAGWGWQDIIWPAQITVTAPLAAGIAAMLALDRNDLRGDIAAATLLLVAISSSAMGLPFLAGAAIELLLLRRPKRLLVVAVPAVLYGAWYLGYGTSSLSLSALPQAPAYVADAFAGAAGGVFGLSTEWGRVLAAAGLALLVHRLLRLRVLTPRLALLLALPLLFWLLIALGRSELHTPDATRYVYVGMLYLLLIAVELATGVRLRTRPLMLLTLGAAVVALAQLGQLQMGAASLRQISTQLSPELTAVELLGPSAPERLLPDPALAPVLAAGPFLRGVRDFGSPVPPPSSLPRQSEAARAAADGVLMQVLTLSPVTTNPPAGAGAGAPVVVLAVGGTLRRTDSCERFNPTGTGAALDLSVMPGSGLAVTAGAAGAAEVRARRFADTYPAPALGVAPAGTRLLLTTPRDGEPALPWRIRVSPAAAVTVCSAA